MCGFSELAEFTLPQAKILRNCSFCFGNFRLFSSNIKYIIIYIKRLRWGIVGSGGWYFKRLRAEAFLI